MQSVTLGSSVMRGLNANLVAPMIRLAQKDSYAKGYVALHRVQITQDVMRKVRCAKLTGVAAFQAGARLAETV